MLDKLFQTIEKITPLKYRWISNHEGFKRYFANTGWMFFGQMFSLVVAFFIGAWLARYLGPENYGVLSYAVAFVGLFGFIASLGVDGVLSRELVSHPEHRDELLGTAFRLKLIGGIIGVVLVVSGAYIFETNSLIRLLIIPFSVSFILQAINVISLYFQAEVKSKNNVKALLFATIVSSLLKISFIILNKGVIWIIIVFALDFLWQGVGLVFSYKRYGLKVRDWRFNKDIALELLKNSWPLMLSLAAGFVYLKIDQVIIGVMLGKREVGIYAAAVKLVEVWYFIPGIICASLFPAIINAKKTGEEFYRQRLKRFYFLLTAIPIIIGIPMTILARPIIYYLFGIDYLGAVSILQIYIWSSPGYFLGLALFQYLMAENKMITIFVVNLVSLIINIILNLLFIPAFGLKGAAFATLISYLFIPILVLMRPKRS